MNRENIRTTNVKKDELNHRLGYVMIKIYNLQNTCTKGVILHGRV